MDDIPEDEIKYRFEIFEYHAAFKTLQIMKDLNLEDENLPKQREIVDKILKQLCANPLFKELKETKHWLYDRIKEARTSVLRTKKDLSEDANISENFYSSMHTLLSQYAHTEPFSINEMAYCRIHEDGSEKLFFNMLDYAVSYFALSIRDFAKSFDLDIEEDVQEIIKESELIVK